MKFVAAMLGALVAITLVIALPLRAQSAAPASPQAAAPAGAPTPICSIGDSITQGFGSNPHVDPTTLEVAALNKLTGGDNYVALSDGQPGTTSLDWTVGGNNAGTPAYGIGNLESMGCAPGAAIVPYMTGTNDSKTMGAAGSPASAAQWKENVESTIRYVLAQGYTKIVLNYAPYINANTVGWNIKPSNDLLVGYQALYVSIAADFPGKVFVGDTTAWRYFKSHKDLLSDGVHPTNAGYAQLSELWANAIAKNFPPHSN